MAVRISDERHRRAARRPKATLDAPGQMATVEMDYGISRQGAERWRDGCNDGLLYYDSGDRGPSDIKAIERYINRYSSNR